MLHAIVAGIVIVVGYSFRPSIDWFDFALIFLSGMGVDVVLNRATGAIAAKAASLIAAKDPKPSSQPGQAQKQTDKTADSAPITPATQPKS
jgi:hypothetical protein